MWLPLFLTLRVFFPLPSSFFFSFYFFGFVVDVVVAHSLLSSLRQFLSTCFWPFLELTSVLCVCVFHLHSHPLTTVWWPDTCRLNLLMFHFFSRIFLFFKKITSARLYFALSPPCWPFPFFQPNHSSPLLQCIVSLKTAKNWFFSRLVVERGRRRRCWTSSFYRNRKRIMLKAGRGHILFF